ncbi:MAG: MFS transporter [Methanomicrobiaceae archaeon]|nr:MFS transporter [Methanomicrobiaceae archaeon]
MEKTTRSILGLSAAHMVNDIYSPVLPAILPLLILQNGYSYFLAGLIVTAYNLSSSFTQPVVGWLYDKKNIRIPIGASVMISAFFMSFIGFVNNYYFLIIFAVAGALGHAFFHPSALGLVSRMAAGANRGRLTSLFVVGGNLGFAIGPILAGLAAGGFGLHGLALIIIPGIAIVFLLRKVLPPVSELETDYSKANETKDKSVKFPYIPITFLVTASAFRAWVIFASVAYLPTFLAQNGMSVIMANLLTSVMLMAGVAGQVIGAGMSDKYGRKEYILASLIFCIPPFALFLLTTGIISLISLMAFGYLLWSSFSVSVAMSHEMAPQGTGMVSGLMLGLAVGAGGLGVAVTGYIADMTSVSTAFGLLIIPVVISFLLFAVTPYPWKSIRQKI